jgi:5-methylcytosine-specific restriction endonuclease McrA
MEHVRVNLCKRCLTVKPVAEFSKHRLLCKACDNLRQRTLYQQDLEHKRAQAQRKMEARRLDPKLAHAYAVKRERRKEQMAFWKKNDPFLWRAQNVGIRGIAVDWFVARWMFQNGRCALTGRHLNILSAWVDHTIPSARGGTDSPDNLRLLCREANATKHSLTDEELFGICREILAGRRKKKERAPKQSGFL